MKKLILTFLTVLTLISLSCRKIEIVEPAQPVLVKVEATHTTGLVVSSEIVFIK